MCILVRYWCETGVLPVHDWCIAGVLLVCYYIYEEKGLGVSPHRYQAVGLDESCPHYNVLLSFTQLVLDPHGTSWTPWTPLGPLVPLDLPWTPWTLWITLAPKADPPGLSFELYLRKWQLTKVVSACYWLINFNTEVSKNLEGLYRIIRRCSSRSYLYGRAQVLWTMEVRVPTVTTGLSAPERWTYSQLEYFLLDTWLVPLNDPILFHSIVVCDPLSLEPAFPRSTCPHLLQGWVSLGEDVSCILYMTLY